LNVIITETILFVLICIGFFLIDPWATAAALIYFGLIGLIMQFFVGSLMNKAGRLAAEQAVKANVAINDLLSVFRELLVLGKRGRYIDAIYRSRVSAAHSSATQYYLSGMPRYIIEAALLVGIALFILSQAAAGDLVKSAATVGVFLSGGFRLTAALIPLQNAFLTIGGALSSANRAHALLSQAKRADPDKSEIDLEGEKTSSFPIRIRFEDVTFAYSGSAQPTLKNITFEVEPGSQLAIIGPSGSGKSTIADLICNALAPSSGLISRTGHPDSHSNQGQTNGVSYVPQRPGLVAGTILENVAIGEDPERIDRIRATEALRVAHLLEFVTSLPEGLDTRLGKHNDDLSGGQMQRIGLARALYTKPGLLVMDEATSALDANSEEAIQMALREMRGKVTVVLIAHRLNTIQHADKVILLEGGQVKDSGTFNELVTRNSSVERLVDLMHISKLGETKPD
jgi:ATP-binding cassette subfamily C protein